MTSPKSFPQLIFTGDRFLGLGRCFRRTRAQSGKVGLIPLKRSTPERKTVWEYAIFSIFFFAYRTCNFLGNPRLVFLIKLFYKLGSYKKKKVVNTCHTGFLKSFLRKKNWSDDETGRDCENFEASLETKIKLQKKKLVQSINQSIMN